MKQSRPGGAIAFMHEGDQLLKFWRSKELWFWTHSESITWDFYIWGFYKAQNALYNLDGIWKLASVNLPRVFD